MNAKYTIIMLSVLLLSACQIRPSNKPGKSDPSCQLDGLLGNCANQYEVAAYLSKNLEILDIPVKPSPYTNYTVKTSADNNFRVYSILDPMSSIYDVHNVFLYRNGDDYDTHVKADAGDWGYIINIGMVASGHKTYYLLISEYVSYHYGMYCTTMISAYSLDRDKYNSLKREPLFITKSGNLTDIIEVSWDDNGSNKDWLNLFGVSLDNAGDTHEVYIQVIDAKSGDAIDKAIVYRWDGCHFRYSGLKPMRIERIEE